MGVLHFVFAFQFQINYISVSFMRNIGVMNRGLITPRHRVKKYPSSFPIQK